METVMRKSCKAICHNQPIPTVIHFHLVPESIVGLDALLLAVVVIQLGEAEEIKSELQGIIVIEELNATSDGKHDISVVLDRQGVDNAGVLANPISRSGNPVVPGSR